MKLLAADGTTIPNEARRNGNYCSQLIGPPLDDVDINVECRVFQNTLKIYVLIKYSFVIGNEIKSMSFQEEG